MAWKRNEEKNDKMTKAQKKKERIDRERTDREGRECDGGSRMELESLRGTVQLLSDSTMCHPMVFSSLD
jgi:hypothetical protein